MEVYRWTSDDGSFSAWCFESWYYGHHYRFYSYSPWHTTGNGTRYGTEQEARRAVDKYKERVLKGEFSSGG